MRHGQQQPAAEMTTPNRHEVLVTRSGTVFLDGERVANGNDADQQAVILDVLQRHAMMDDGPVEAIVLDRRARCAVVIEVAPDGSSQVVTEY